MKVIEDGHIYSLETQDGDGAPEILTFVNREKGRKHSGTQTQEVVRALIQRTQHCDACLRWTGNDEIIQHFRMIIALHEARGLIRKADKKLYKPELVRIGVDGHFQLHSYEEIEPQVSCSHIHNPVER